MANFMIRFLLCNVLISGIIGILLIAKWVFRNNLSSRMQYNLWLLLLGILAVPFMPFRLVSFPQIFSWLSSVQNSTTSHADVGTNNVMNTDLSGTTNWMNDFALSVNHDTLSVTRYILSLGWKLGKGLANSLSNRFMTAIILSEAFVPSDTLHSHVTLSQKYPAKI